MPGCGGGVEEALVVVNVTSSPGEPHRPVPVEVTVDGCLVSFNGVPTLWLNEPLPIGAVLADETTQHVAAMYRAGYVHRAGRTA